MESATPIREAKTAEKAVRWTAGKLFRRRAVRFWIEQWRVWKTALDWTVWLYLIIPAVWIGGGLYIESWSHPPVWLTGIPVWLGEGVPLLLVFAGRLRTFAEDGDVLFLLQRKRWGQRLTLLGMLYTACMLALIAVPVYVLLLPFLYSLHYIPAAFIASLYALTVIWSFLGAVARSLIQARYRGFRKFAASIGCGIFLGVSYAASIGAAGLGTFLILGAIAAGLIGSLWLGRIKLRARYSFENDVQLEHKARLASTELLLSGVIERKPRLRLNRPVVLRGSKRLFKRFDGETILAEAVLKAFVRRLPLVQKWLQFVGVATIAASLSPLWLRLPMLIVLPVFFAYWVQSHWRAVTGEPFLKQFKWPDAALKRSAELTRLWIVAPAVCVLGLAAGLQMYHGWGALMCVPALAVWYAVNKMLTDIMQLQSKKKGSA